MPNPQVKVSLEPEIKDLFTKRAKERGLSLSSYMREATLEKANRERRMAIGDKETK